MAKVLVCDMCKRGYREIPILATVSHYKMKRANPSLLSGWERIDICSECEREIRFKVQQAKEEK